MIQLRNYAFSFILRQTHSHKVYYLYKPYNIPYKLITVVSHLHNQ